MLFFQDILIPFIIAAIVIVIISSLLNLLLRILHLGFVLIKVPLFLVVWYFVGPVIYNWLISGIIVNTSEWIRFIFIPFQYISNFFSQLM